MILPPSAMISLTPFLPCSDADHRMGDESRLAGRIGDLAEHRIEQERHVVVDDGDGGERAAVADDGGIGIDGDDALALAVGEHGLLRERRRPGKHGGIIGGGVFGRRAGKQIGGEVPVFWKSSRIFGLQLPVWRERCPSSNPSPKHAFPTIVAEGRRLATGECCNEPATTVARHGRTLTGRKCRRQMNGL